MMTMYIPTKKHNNGIALGWDESKQKDVLAAAVVTLECSLAKGRESMENNLLVLGANEMVDDVRARGVTARVAKPLFACLALYHRRW